MTKIRVLVLAAALSLLTGCATTDDGASTPIAAPPRGGQAATAPPVPSEPSTPPSEPTDDIKATSIVVGTVNRGGSGPCYGLITDDGVQYALYEAKGRELQIGVRVKADVTPSQLRIGCGAGTLVEVTTLAPLR